MMELIQERLTVMLDTNLIRGQVVTLVTEQGNCRMGVGFRRSANRPDKLIIGDYGGLRNVSG